MSAPLKSETNELQIGRLMFKTARKYLGVLGRYLSHIEIERYFSAVLLIEQSEKPMTQNELAAFLGVDKVAIVRMIDYLTDKNILERKINPADRRERFLQLTRKARKMTPEIHDAILSINDAATEGLSEQKKKQFLQSLLLIHANLSKLPAEDYNIQIRKKRRK